ncbi:MAG TPA: SlyX family protein [Verrucomicrobiae bacterium]|nr:SlyX family protein [Verrucomicrobiae bacterium]
MEDRIEKLESHVAFLERQYEELNQVVIEQGRALMRIQAELARASETLRTAEIERIRANNPKPPHYQ